jgi:inward rectifier potassium channel
MLTEAKKDGTLRSNYMQKPTFDPGLTQQFGAPWRRAINKDGSFNVLRRGVSWRALHPYMQLINMSWPRFLMVIFLAYLVVNTIFASVYYSIGAQDLQGVEARTKLGQFMSEFFFSSQTLSTVGYGVIAPKGLLANMVASLEAMTGLMGFALATGLLFGRFSRPSARIGFSSSMVVAPYQDGMSLQFRIVNERPNSLMELEAQVMLMIVEGLGNTPQRSFKMLKLEREGVLFFPLTWTIVHPIDQDSPLYGLGEEELRQMQAEFLILIKGYDDTFSQTVHARYSYRADELIWRAKFSPAFHIEEGDMVLDVDKVGELAQPPAPVTAS